MDVIYDIFQVIHCDQHGNISEDFLMWYRETPKYAHIIKASLVERELCPVSRLELSRFFNPDLVRWW